jgi:DNA-binding transcriptional ArsR family regulator
MSEGDRDFAPPLEQVLVYPARIKILGTLAEATEPIPPAEVQQHANIAKSTFYDHWNTLEELDLIEVKDGTENVQLTDTAGADAIVSLNQFLGEQLSQQGEVESEISSLLQ